MSTPRLARLAVFATLVACGAVAARAAETVTFGKRHAAGDKVAFSQAMTNEQSVTATANGQVLQQQSQTMKNLRAGTVTIEAVDANGKPTKATYAFDKACGGEMSSGGQTQPIPSGLAGKTVTVTRVGEKELNYSAVVDEQSAAELKQMFDDPSSLLPTKPIAVGESWEFDPKDFTGQMPPNVKVTAKGSGKLLGVQTVGGRQVATVEFSVNISGTDPTGATMKSDLSGKGTVDVTSGQPVDLTFGGPSTAGGVQQTPNGPVQFAMTSKMNMTFKVTRQGGDVPAPAPQPVPNPVAGGDVAGTYANEKMTVKLAGAANALTGTIKTGDKEYPIATATNANGKVSGKFTAGANAFEFTATLAGDTLTLETGGATYVLKKQAAGPANPLAQ